MKINKYPDGTSYVTIPEQWEDTQQEIIFKINSYEDVIHLTQLCDVLIYNRVKAHIIIPNLIDAQADRRFNEFQSSGLSTICRILDDYIDGYNISVGVFHPHNPEVVEALMDNVEIIDNSQYIKMVLSKLAVSGEIKGNMLLDEKGYNMDNLILMSSDAGGFKPLMKLCDKLNWKGSTYSASKHRTYIDGKSKLVQSMDRMNFDGRDILIIDDISVYGGTFKNLSKLLKERNCGKLYLAVSHMTVQHLGEDPVTNYFDKVFTTNSKFDNYFKQTKNGGTQPKNLEIIKLF